MFGFLTVTERRLYTSALSGLVIKDSRTVLYTLATVSTESYCDVAQTRIDLRVILTGPKMTVPTFQRSDVDVSS